MRNGWLSLAAAKLEKCNNFDDTHLGLIKITVFVEFLITFNQQPPTPCLIKTYKLQQTMLKTCLDLLLIIQHKLDSNKIL